MGDTTKIGSLPQYPQSRKNAVHPYCAITQDRATRPARVSTIRAKKSFVRREIALIETDSQHDQSAQASLSAKWAALVRNHKPMADRRICDMHGYRMRTLTPPALTIAVDRSASSVASGSPSRKANSRYAA